MDRNFAPSLSLALKEEGGWTDNPKDPGGATMRGVTLVNFRKFVKPNATKEDLRNITDDQISTVYRRHYWNEINGAELPDGVDCVTFDFAVNSGPGRSAMSLQKVVGVTQDGKIGPATIEAINAKGAENVVNLLCDERLAFMKRAKGSAGDLKGKLLWPTFGKGWSARVGRVRAAALKMVTQPTPEKPAIIEKVVTEEKPVVPPKVEKEVRQKTSWGAYLLSLLGVGTGGASWLASANWQLIVTLIVVGVVAAGILLFAGEWIVHRIRALRAELEA